MAHTHVKTKTVPKTLTIKEAAKLSDRDTSQIHYAIRNKFLDYGFLMDGPEYITKGQKVIIHNAKWEKWLGQRVRNEQIRSERMLKEARELRLGK